MLLHKDCGGTFVHWEIREHHYSFMQCDRCGRYLGGDKIKEKVRTLLRTKVKPTVRQVS